MNRTALVTCVILAGFISQTSFAVDDEIGHLVNGLSSPTQLAGEAPQTMTLPSRMEHYRIPGVSIAVFRNGAIIWAKGFGVTEAGGSREVTTETRFQAASITKAVTAITALALIEQKRLMLDDPITPYLGDWTLPSNPFPPYAVPTLRQIISHTAGFSVSGFTGYEKGERLPTLRQILDGTPPADNKPIQIVFQPGSKSQYSGGGYMVLQQIIENASGIPFTEAVQRSVLSPAGMSMSGFWMESIETLGISFAAGHNGDGVKYPGGYIVYPEASPAGLWSTPSDLAKLATEVQASLAGRSNKILSPAMTRTMLKRQKDNWALGWEFMTKKEPTASFYASGSNRGFKSWLYARRDGSGGIAIMTNGDNGGSLFGEILAGAGIIYGWDDAKPEFRSYVKMSATALSVYGGSYAFSEPVQGTLIVTVHDQYITIEIPGIAAASKFYPSGENKFFDLNGNTAQFGTGNGGSIATLAIGDVIGRKK